MKAYKFLIITGILFFFCSDIYSQNLIERTRRGIAINKERVKPNELSRKIQAIAPGQFLSYPVFNYAQTNTFRSFEDKVHLDKAAFLTLQDKAIERVLTDAPGELTLSIPVSAFRNINVQLSATKVLSEDFVMRTNTGRLLFPEDFEGAFYSGIVADDPGSVAFFSFSESGIRGMVSDREGNYNLGPLDNRGRYVFYPDREKKFETGGICETPDDGGTYKFPLQDEAASRAKAMDEDNCIKVYVECDFAMYNANGSSLGGVFDYVTSLFNGVIAVYTNESIPVELSEIFVWETDDPYSGEDNTKDALDAFVAQRGGGFNGNLAHLLTTRAIGGGRAKGIGGLCSDSGALPFSVSGSMGNTSVPAFPNNSWDLIVFTHEMGHNLGSRHTQACVWNGDNTQIDDCGNFALTTNGADDDDDGDIDELDEAEGDACYDDTAPIIPASGTIMSYCHLVNSIDVANGFGMQPGNVIRKSYADGDCLSQCNCLTADRNIPGIIPQGVYAAGNSITSDGQVLANTIVNFKAGNFIDLTEGFEAEEACFFQAEIEGCFVPLGGGGGSLTSGTDLDHRKEKLSLNKSAINESFSIHPNPAAEMATITYSIAQPSKVSVYLFDMTGRLLNTLEENIQKEAGHHQLALAAGDLKPGAYFCVLKTETGTKTLRFITIAK